jgi:hypothetical protein
MAGNERSDQPCRRTLSQKFHRFLSNRCRTDKFSAVFGLFTGLCFLGIANAGMIRVARFR